MFFFSLITQDDICSSGTTNEVLFFFSAKGGGWKKLVSALQTSNVVISLKGGLAGVLLMVLGEVTTQAHEGRGGERRKIAGWSRRRKDVLPIKIKAREEKENNKSFSVTLSERERETSRHLMTPFLSVNFNIFLLLACLYYTSFF